MILSSRRVVLLKRREHSYARRVRRIRRSTFSHLIYYRSLEVRSVYEKGEQGERRKHTHSVCKTSNFAHWDVKAACTVPTSAQTHVTRLIWRSLSNDVSAYFFNYSVFHVIFFLSCLCSKDCGLFEGPIGKVTSAEVTKGER